ncbi:G-protein coupled receptor 143-like [Tubulanus polymorphus]|uniref:G-protein coupled receptor 143-like n=1 Tax=Tubulanus polymorphus TaxID=672921 RepID=UPI003DA5FB73
MASPGLESFCCLLNFTELYRKGYIYDPTDHDNDNDTSSVLDDPAYNGFCIGSSAISIIGTLLLFPWREHNKNPTKLQFSHEISGKLDTLSNGYLNGIIFWLVITDLSACTALLIRACVWLTDYDPLSNALLSQHRVDFAHMFCVFSTAIIQFSYICTYLWTMCYAVEVTLVLRGYKIKKSVYHLAVWIMSGLLCVGGLVPLYTPSLLECHDDKKNIIPHFLSSYLPMTAVMIVNPVLYIYNLWSVKEIMSKRFGRYTNQERKMVNKLRGKFFFITLVFYICWLPNIVNGILLIFRKDIDRRVFRNLWVAMAALNPLQALLNTIFYGQYKRVIELYDELKMKLTCEPLQNDVDDYSYQYISRSANESSRLLQYR